MKITILLFGSPLMFDETDSIHRTDRRGDYTCLYMKRHYYYPVPGSTTLSVERN